MAYSTARTGMEGDLESRAMRTCPFQNSSTRFVAACDQLSPNAGTRIVLARKFCCHLVHDQKWPHPARWPACSDPERAGSGSGTLCHVGNFMAEMKRNAIHDDKANLLLLLLFLTALQKLGQHVHHREQLRVIVHAVHMDVL